MLPVADILFRWISKLDDWAASTLELDSIMIWKEKYALDESDIVLYSQTMRDDALTTTDACPTNMIDGYPPASYWFVVVVEDSVDPETRNALAPVMLHRP